MMASISTNKVGLRRLYFYDINGTRRILYLGKISKKQAEAIATRVENIVAAKAAKSSISLDDATWLGEIGDTLHCKLVKVGLATNRESISQKSTETTERRVTLGEFLDRYIDKRTDVKPGTKWVYRHTQRNLLAFFGPGKELASIHSADADDFRLWLADVEKLAEATLRKRCSVARQFFRRALKTKLIGENPFGEMKNISVGSSPEERMYFLIAGDFEKVVNAIPVKQVDLRTVFALARWGGMRCPSEPAALKWGQVDWKKGRLTVASPKTGKREMPIFPELRPFLAAAFRNAEALGRAGAGDSVVMRGDGSTNWRSGLEDAIRRAGMKPWPKLFQNLRSTRETELMKQFPIAVVCKWLGNSPKIALAHYSQVTDADFEAALGCQKATQNPTRSAADKRGPGGTRKDTHPGKRDANKKRPGKPGACNEPVGTRTRDLRIKSPLLYRLSYRLQADFLGVSREADQRRPVGLPRFYHSNWYALSENGQRRSNGTRATVAPSTPESQDSNATVYLQRSSAETGTRQEA